MQAIRELRASRQAPCRVCGRPNQRCLNYAAGGVLCMNYDTPEAKRVDCGTLGDGYYYPPTDNLPRLAPIVSPPKPSPPASASPLEKDRIYRALLEVLSRMEHRGVAKVQMQFSLSSIAQNLVRMGRRAKHKILETLCLQRLQTA